MEVFKHNKIFDFVAWSKYGLIISIILTLISLYLFFVVKFTLGIDFAGGSVAQIKYEKAVALESIRSELSKNELFHKAQVSEFGSSDEILIKIPYSEDLNISSLDSTLRDLLKSTGNFEIRKLDAVGARVGDELARSAIISLVLATIMMMAYVSYRYEWRFALASIIALVHDIIITAASVIVFKIDLNLEVIAALLTLLGYSINDTIIVFDRIREKMMDGKLMNIKDVINEAISSTLSRTTLTSLTMFFVVLTLYLFGGEIIVGFSLPMLVGVVFGTYSSMFVAPALAILFGFSIEKYHAKEVAKAKAKEEKKRLRQMYEGGRV